ncbi:MAG: lysine--tRNA ligase [Mycoplasma sp.]|nr:lysine--tRNA ligase [Mycoplasma sp.]
MSNKIYSDLEKTRIEKIKGMINENLHPYSQTKKITENSKTLNEKWYSFTKEELSQKKNNEALVAGRVMGTRGPFIIISDRYSRIQLYLAKKEFPEINNITQKFMDIGDIVWASGKPMKTNTGELSLRINDFTILSKSIRSLPEKYHGLQNIEERYRRRYLDLIMNNDAREVLLSRTKITKSIRKFFDNLDYLEVDTPILQSILGGAAAKPFKTYHNALSMDFYLRIATELPLKKLIVGGMERVYEIGRLFRNEGVDTTHNPEFTTIEFYEAYSDMHGMMNRVESLFHFIANETGVKEVELNGVNVDLTKPFHKINMLDAIKNETGIDFRNVHDLQEAQKYAKEHDIKIEKFFKIGHIINQFFEKYIEEKLIEPTFIYHYPIEISPLAAKDIDDPRFTQRSELFIGKKEYANLYTELNDPIDQLERFESQTKERELGNDEASEIDMDFVEALEQGMPPTGGAGIGIDRLIMLFTNKKSIRDVILFPHLKNKPRKKGE